MAERRAFLLKRQDRLRQAVVCEPRGHDAIVGALLTPPVEPGSAAGVVFFNNSGRPRHVRPRPHRRRAHARAPGPSRARARPDRHAGRHGRRRGLEPDGAVTIENVPAFCHARDVEVEVPGLGRVTGDVAWGGNWFFLAERPELPLDLAHVTALTTRPRASWRALRDAGDQGTRRGARSTTSSFGPPRRPDADSRNFVLCPGLAWDRSPCGTGTSAKMAALAARGSSPRASAGGRRASPARSSRAGSRRGTGPRPPRARPGVRDRPGDALLQPPRPLPRGLHRGPMRAASAIVVGAGIVGAACAEALAEAGPVAT